MPATRSRREIRVLLVLAIAGAVAAIAVFGFALQLASVNASAAQRANLAGVPEWALRPRSLDPICDWIAVAGIAIAIGAAVLLLAGKRAPRLPGSSRPSKLDLLWKCGAWSIAGHALFFFGFTPLAEADDMVDTGSYESVDIADELPPPDDSKEPDDDPNPDPRMIDGPCMMGTPSPPLRPPAVLPPPEPLTTVRWNARPVVAVAPVVLGIPTTNVASERSSLRRTMKHQILRLGDCYTHAHAEGSGTIVATFTIGSTGAVTHARANGFDPAVAACVAKLVRESHFPRPSDGASSDVMFPISYRGH